MKLSELLTALFYVLSQCTAILLFKQCCIASAIQSIFKLGYIRDKMLLR